MVILRDMIQSDIEDYVKWFTDPCQQNDWTCWDAPWEQVETTVDEERKSWTDYYQYLQTLPINYTRWKFEIEVDGQHIGWVSAYTDLGYLDNEARISAIGIDIPNRTYRNCGYGKQALTLFIDYLRGKGHTTLFTQTWSGNIPMIKLAHSLGFVEYARVKDLRKINNQQYDAITFKLNL